MILASSIGENPIFIILILLAFFGAIVGLVIFLKKKVTIFKDDVEVKTDKEIAEEELNRVLVDIEEETKKSDDDIDEISHEDDTLARQLGEIDDPEAIKAMEEYAREHQEEEGDAE